MSDGYQITLPLSERLASSGIDASFLPVSIDGREYLVDLTTGRYRRSNVDVLKTKTNQAFNENLLVEPEVWRSVRETMHEGAGQTDRDRENSSNARFHTSKNVDVWDKWRVRLLPATTELRDSSESTLVCISVANGLAVIDGTTVAWYDAPDATPTTTTATSTPLSWTTDGASLYLALSGGAIEKITLPGLTKSTFVTMPGTAGTVAYIKGMLVASHGPDLYDISSGAATANELFYTHPLADHEWRSGTDGLAAGYILGGQGSRWMVYWLAVKDDASTFNPPVVAAPLPEGEIGHGLGSYLGNVLIGTDRGVRFAAPSGDNTLVYGRLIETNGPVTSFTGEDRFVWFPVGGATARDDRAPLYQPEAGLARMDLSTFVADMTPAYAADLVAAGEPSVTASSVASLAGKRVFSVPGEGVFIESDEKAASGWVKDGRITMGVQDPKVGLYMTVVTEPLDGQVSIDAMYDDGSGLTVLVMSGDGSVTSGNHYLGRRFRSVRTTLNLVKGTGDGPVVSYVELRAVPSVGAAHQWEVPLLLAADINYEDARFGRYLRQDVDTLLQLVESARVFTFREGELSHQVYASGYEWYPTSIVDDEWQGVLVLKMRSIR